MVGREDDYVCPPSRSRTRHPTDLRASASIFYIDEDGNIANGYFNCNMTTGMFLSQGNWVISAGAPTPHSNSGLASIVLGSESGYRVYYHDSDGAINELSYTNDDGWKYLGVISHDINSLPALGAAFSGKNNITVVSPRDEQNIGVTRYTKDDTWYRSRLCHVCYLAVCIANVWHQPPCRRRSRATLQPPKLTGATSP